MTKIHYPPREKWAGFINDKLVEITNTEPKGRYHDNITFVKVPDRLIDLIDNSYLLQNDKIIPQIKQFKDNIQLRISEQANILINNGIVIDDERYDRSNIDDFMIYCVGLDSDNSNKSIYYRDKEYSLSLLRSIISVYANFLIDVRNVERQSIITIENEDVYEDVLSIYNSIEWPSKYLTVKHGE